MAPSVRLGDVRITCVRAGTYLWDGGAFFGVVPKTLWSRHVPSDPLNRVEASFNCFVVETGRRRLLIETGGGVRHDARWKDRTGMHSPVTLRDALSEAGFPPDSIDTVINTHLHWDHASGNTVDENGAVLPAFPNAKYLVQRGELEHARERHPRDSISYLPVNYEPLVESGHLQLLDGDYQAAPQVELRVAPGHNRDMMVVLVHGGEGGNGGHGGKNGDGREHGTWCHLADLAPFAAHITPTWVASFDLFPLETIATKEQLLGRAANEGWWLSFGHDPSIAFAKIECLGGKWQLQQSQP